MRALISLALLALVAACADRNSESLVPLGIANVSAFPADASLMRAEDGVILSDGRVVVADQAHGLRAVNPDGSSAPFGRFAEAGYAHSAELPAGPNGVAFTPDRRHILVADIYTGAIWRVSIADEGVEKVHQHAFGVNSAIEDASGAIWFTQSAANVPGRESAAGMFAAIDRPIPNGKLYRLQGLSISLMKDGLAFANGLAIDPQRGRLYVAETMADRVWVFDLDPAQPEKLGEGRAFATVATPDNVKIGRGGLVYVASPIESALVAIGPDSGAATTYFSGQTAESAAIAREWKRRAAGGEGVIDLFTPAVWGTLPGAVTSVILDDKGEPAYLGNLGNALIKFEEKKR